MQNKIMDVIQPKDNWERGYAHLEYEHAGLIQVGGKKIEITQVYICCNCKKQNTYWRWLCEACSNLPESERADDSF